MNNRCKTKDGNERNNLIVLVETDPFQTSAVLIGQTDVQVFMMQVVACC